MTNYTNKTNNTTVNDLGKVISNTALKVYDRNIRGLRNKCNELYCHLLHDAAHIICLFEHHLKESELQLLHLNDYFLGAKYCIKSFQKGGVSILAYRS
jgi:hypothetical protein